MAAQVRDEDPPIAGQLADQVIPRRTVLTAAMQQHHRLGRGITERSVGKPHNLQIMPGDPATWLAARP